MLTSTVGLPFFRKVLQCACQGDTKRTESHTRASTALFWDLARPGPPNHACASPVTLQILVFLFGGSEGLHPPHLLIFRLASGDTNLGSSKFPGYFFLAKFVVRLHAYWTDGCSVR